MFGFLKDKLKNAINKFSKDVEKDAETTQVKPETQSEIKEEPKEEIKEEAKEEIQQEEIEEIRSNKPSEIISAEEETQIEEQVEIKTEKEEVKKQVKEIKTETKAPEQMIQEPIKVESKKQILKETQKNKKDYKEAEQKETEYISVTKADEESGELDEDIKEELQEKKGFFSKLKDKFSKKTDEKKKKKEEEKEIIEKEIIAELEKKTSEKELIEEEFEKELEEELKDKTQIRTEQDKIEAVAQHVPLEPAEKQIEEELKKKEEKQKEKGGFFSKLTDAVTKTNLTEEKFNDIFWELEIILMENNVAVEVIDKLKADLKKELVDSKVKRGTVDEIIMKTLRNTVNELFDVERFDLISKIKTKKPFVITFFGINGSGKTTTIAKLAYLLKQQGLNCVIAAGDTFRAAAIQQMEEHTQKLNIRLIKHEYGADPAAVAFDAIKYAEAKAIDVVLIDTAGRMHSNANLMDEMKKIIRVAKPDLKIFIGEAITGNDCVDQAKEFNSAIGIDAIILCKADVDEKGGAALSISYVTKKPILYLGVGQNYQDLKPFDKQIIMESIGVA